MVMLVGNKTDLDEDREVTFQVPHGGRQQEGALVSVDLRAFETLKHTHTCTHILTLCFMYSCTHLHTCTCMHTHDPSTHIYAHTS